jgi:hypothetical protein
MMRWTQIVILLAMVFGPLLGGCSDGASPSKTSPKGNARVAPPAPPAPPTSGTASEQPADNKSVERQLPKETSASRPQPAPAARSSSAIRLSTGVALAQTGPNGTMMLFSVDYEYLQGEPTPNRDVLVIERAHGGPHRVLVAQSKQQDGRSLATYREDWRPGDGPFHAHVEDAKGNRISESIELQ